MKIKDCQFSGSKIAIAVESSEEHSPPLEISGTQFKNNEADIVIGTSATIQETINTLSPGRLRTAPQNTLIEADETTEPECSTNANKSKQTPVARNNILTKLIAICIAVIAVIANLSQIISVMKEFFK